MTVREQFQNDPDHIISELSELLDELLEYGNQENSFRVLGITEGKLIVAFDIVEVPEDNYIGFQGY